MKTCLLLFTAAITTAAQANAGDALVLIAALGVLLLSYGAYRLVRDIRMALRIDLEGLHLEDI